MIYAPNGEEYRTPHQHEQRDLWIYEIVKNGVVLYVGKTTRPRQRFYAHRATGLASGGAIMRLVRQCADVDDLQASEIRHIQQIKPKRNLVYANKMPHDEAYHIWVRPRLSVKERLAMMPGWTSQQAHYAFTRRMISDGLLEDRS